MAIDVGGKVLNLGKMIRKFICTYLGGRKELKMSVKIDKILNAGIHEANLCKISLYTRKLGEKIDAKYGFEIMK